MSTRFDIDIPSVGEAGPGYAAKINAALATLNGDYVVDTLDDRDAIASPANNAYCLVESTDRIYRWVEADEEWRPLDIDYINVLDYGADWTLADNTAAFQAAVDADANTVAKVIKIPSPPIGATPMHWQFEGSIDIKYPHGGLHFKGVGGNALTQFCHKPMVALQNTVNSEPIFDGDNDAIAPGLTGANTQFVTFEGLEMYQPGATVVNLSHVFNFWFLDCAIITFAEAAAVRAQNCFWMDFEKTVFFTANGGAVGCIRLEGAAGNPNVESSYLISARECRFSGGPMIEYHVHSTSSTTGVSFISLENCSGETQDKDVGCFVRFTRTGSATAPVSGLSISNCGSFDPLGGGGSRALVKNIQAVSINGLAIKHSSMIGGANRVVMDGNNLLGFEVEGSVVSAVDASDNPLGSLYGYSLLGIQNGARFTGVGPGAANISGDLWQLGNPSHGINLGQTGDVYARMVLSYDGYIHWGSGAADATDVNLYRESANVLCTDDKLHVKGELELDGAFNHDGSTAGFFGAAPAGQQSIGIAASDAASTQTLANGIRTALINLGLCTT